MRSRLVVALVAGAAGLGALPVAQAATVAPTVESWFQPNPSCSGPAGCLSAPSGPTEVTVFPEGTLHVGASGGQENARTYLGLPAAALDGLASASLEVPLDTSPSSGTVAPDSAKVQVCLTTARLAEVEGSFAEPPEADCDRTAPASYVATPVPRLVADLRPLLDGAGRATGLVLLPDTREAPAGTWRVVFSSRDREDAAKTPPATLAVERASAAEQPAVPSPAEPADLPPAPADSSLEDVPSDALPQAPDVEPELGSAPAPAPDGAALLAEGPVAAAEPLAVQQVGAPETVRVGYAYPGVWLLPLGLLVVVPLVARTLTRDLTPRDAAEDDAQEQAGA